MSIQTLHSNVYEKRAPLAFGRGLPKKNARIQTAHLPGYDELRRANVLKMYEGLSPSERSKLRAQRAQRALDVIDLFHADIRDTFHYFTPRQQAGLLEVLLLTNNYRHKLRGLANGMPSEL